ncbi:MAG: hypothetical protein KKD86_19410 [Bacteroidetes bacterium]|nr:hypothetical protein [Bacteroidota bacterium]
MKNQLNITVRLILFISAVLVYSTSIVTAQNEDCLACHSDNSLTYEKNGKEVSLFVNEEKYSNSIHTDIACTDCHEDYDAEELPHKEGENIYKVDCSSCHDVGAFGKSVHGQKKVDCSNCHSKHEIKEASEFKGNEKQLCLSCHKTSNVKAFEKSIHAVNASDKSLSCLDCHNGTAHEVTSAKFSEEQLHSVCSSCHQGAVDNFEKSLHGEALTKGRFLAPNCLTCHGSHKILSSKNEKSITYKMNIPSLCGDCHKDGTRVSELRNISQRHILADYQFSIHADGIFKRGLLGSAVCTDCHFSHNILPHENPKSSINRKNIASTCTQCHVQIEKVHAKVIKGELWEKQPHVIPACVDCHQPHKVRRVVYEEKYTDKLCMSCHGNKNLTKEADGKSVSLYVDYEKLGKSVHFESSCIKCHTNVNVKNNPICISSGKVDCSMCHAEQVAKFAGSRHGTLHAEGSENAPYCTDCHGKHDMYSKNSVDSPTSRRHIPDLCAQCHRSGEKASVLRHDQRDIVANYAMSIHGKGLLSSGLTVTATCIDCHETHHELPATDSNSTVNHNNISETCSKCHYGIYEKFQYSIHSPEVNVTKKLLPVCSDCHQSHTIKRVDQDNFRQHIYEQCGNCHLDVTDTYFETFHGKVSKLGAVQSAKCYDCHGAHEILPSYDPGSKLHRNNIVETCKTCHPNSNRMFVGYLTHATHHDREKYPFLFYTFWGMTILLVSTFTFFGLHTLLWLPRALAERKRHKKNSDEQNK